MTEENIVSFLKEATRELLYNVVRNIPTKFKYSYGKKYIRKEFKKKFEHQPEKLFGIHEVEWGDVFPLKIRNAKKILGEESYNYNIEVAEYRKTLLHEACRLLAEHEDAKDYNGNTALHLIAALLPESGEDRPILLEYLLDAGVDSLEINNQGLNFLHIIAGRLQATYDDDGNLYFVKKYINSCHWETSYRILDVICLKLSPDELQKLVKTPGRDGNTSLHEWVLASSSPSMILTDDDFKFATELLVSDNTIMLQNQSGFFPLHFAYNSNVFMFLVEKDASCFSVNGAHETPLFFILKHAVYLAFVNTPAFAEIEEFLPKDGENAQQNLKEAIFVLNHLTTSLKTHDALAKTLWTKDIKNNTPLEIILVSIKCSCYIIDKLIPFDVEHFNALRGSLFALVNLCLERASTKNLNRRNKKDQPWLHILLDLNLDIWETLDKGVDAISGCLGILLNHGIDKTAKDNQGRTVMDIIQHHNMKAPGFSAKCMEIIKVSKPMTKRKLKSCIKYHEKAAVELTQAEDVTIVKKYRYSSDKPIGTGAFSSIYVAIKDEHVQPNGEIYCRAIALKRLEKGKADPKEIKREIGALLTISTDCENILNCYESFEDEFFYYLSLDLMVGDLKHFVENRAATTQMMQEDKGLVKAAQDILNGVLFLHENEYLHRDLKPGNILYNTEPRLNFKIGDFGLAKNISANSTMTTTKAIGVASGTRCWMAPELLMGSEHSKESDVFSLGLVLHFLFSFGRHPFIPQENEPTFMTEKKIADMSLFIHPSLNEEGAHLIEILLVKQPGRRVPAKYIHQHTFFWSDHKKLELLKVVGDQPEAIRPTQHQNSELEVALQETQMAGKFALISWDLYFPHIFSEITKAWKQKKYRTKMVIDFIRFIRNCYAHKEEQSPGIKGKLENYIFLKEFPSMTLEVLGALQKIDFENKRPGIAKVLEM